MQHGPNDDSSDSILVPFLTAKSESISDELLRAIIDEIAEPIIKRILRSKLRVSLNGRGTQQNQDALEIAGDLRATLVSTLRALRQNPNKAAIVSFPDFVAIKTYSACADYFREKHPQRWRLKTLLRRRLRQNPRFALWQAEDKRWYAGFGGRLSEPPGVAGGPMAPSPPATAGGSDKANGKLSNAQIKSDEFLVALFERSGKPIDFDEVVKLAAETWHIHDPPTESIDTGSSEIDHQFSSSEPRIDLALEQRLFFEQVWSEVCQLPVLQRAALLLNLRDSRDGGVISFLPFLGVASKEELARLLEIPYEDFEKLWSELPLDDLRIAQMLGITRQQVINLRKTARERLARRMRKLEEK
ncbi:MAG TPA: hypothetical protein VJT50_14410 [Pyrinomonadaceae bacterium]|nr:hypothetical protein [Pyrinomonadaceae bacterium]